MNTDAAFCRTAVIGAGSWGTALAAASARAGTPTLLVARDPQVADSINSTHRNCRYLEQHPLPPSLQATTTADSAAAFLSGARQQLVVLAVPVLALRDTASEWLALLDRHAMTDAAVVWTCKGFENQTALLPHEIMAQSCGRPTDLPIGVLSGPSFAAEVIQGLPVALTIASHHSSVRDVVTAVYHQDYTRIYQSDDIIGVEVGGALKNVMAIACGIADGMALGSNARAALITRGLAEIARLGTALGGNARTFAGLTGLGDLVLTATGDLSRNRQVGLALGQGQALQKILESGLTAEGVRCARAAYERACQLNIDMPITEAICGVLRGKKPQDAMNDLLLRNATSEF